MLSRKPVKPVSPLQDPTAGQVLADGTVIELVRGPKDRNRLSLIFSRGKRSEIISQFEYRGRIYVPAALHPTHMHAIQFPTHAADFGTTAKLFGKIRGLMQRYASLPSDDAALVAYFVFATWFSDCFSEPPTLLITGPSAESLQLLRLLSCCCRRSLRAKHVTLSTLSSLPLEFNPTLLLDERGQSARTLQFLTSSGGPDFCVPGNGGVRYDGCAKAIYAGPGSGVFLTDCEMRVPVNPYVGAASLLSPNLRDELAETFQPMLLAYRLVNYNRVLNSKFDVPQFTTTVRKCAHRLGASVNDAELQAAVVPLLQEQDEAARDENTSALEAVVIEAVLVMCHQKKPLAYVGEIADRVNTILQDRGEAVRLNAKAVGTRLNSLGLFTGRLGAAGRGLSLTKKMSRKAHQIARDFHVRTFENSGDMFDCCREFQPANDAVKQ